MRLLLILLFSLNLFAVDATMKIEKDVEDRAHIGLVDGSNSVNHTFFNTLQSDLKISGHFLADKKHHTGAFDGTLIDPSLKRNEYILKYRLAQQGGNTLKIRLIKAADGREIFHKTYGIPNPSKIPFLAHKAIADVNHALHYPDISWMNRYVIFSRYIKSGESEVVLADYTFGYQKVIIKGGLNLFPKWADGQQHSFYYSSYKGLMPTLYKIDIYTGKKRKIISSEGMLVCSDVSKDGSRLLLTMAPHGQADIYEYSLNSGNKTRITHFNGIDVSGKYVDDESRIIFISNRLGYANIFKKPIHSSAVSQIVYHGRNNNGVDAYRDSIVYSSREGRGSFNLYLASSFGSSTRPLTSTGKNQFPRFSSDGSVIQYIKHYGRGSSIGYSNLQSHQSLLFPLSGHKIQSIDW